jgi:hypothetical protein
MKVITIVQPWATLLAIGEKKFETRSWHTKYRGELAIHASKKTDKVICNYEPFHSILVKHGYTEANLPTGMILAIGQLTDCCRVEQNNGTAAILTGGHIVSGNEYIFGNFSDGRYAWQITDVTSLNQHIPVKGRLGLWEYQMDGNLGE